MSKSPTDITANFAAHKTYQLQQKLLEIKKEAANEKDFVNKAKSIVVRFNQYQKTEYNTFVALSRTAKQWDTFQQEKHLFPNLTWIRTRSANPRELHLGYVGITLPMNDPFWQTNQPGNLWNCKCDWKTTDAQPTAEPAKIIPPMAGLEGNPYYTGKIITNNHPYFKDAPNWVKKNAMLLAPEELVYSNLDTKKGSLITHVLSKDENGYASNISISKILLNKEIFKEIRFLPEINAKEQFLREKYYGSEYCKLHKTTCPDILADKIIVELKENSGAIGSLKKRIKKAASQSNFAIIKISNIPKEQILNNIIDGSFNKYKKLERIIIFNGKGELVLDKMTKAN